MSAAKQRPISSLRMFKPTPEQQNAVDLFQTGASLKVNAYAGTGKTSTLTLLAQGSLLKSGQYISYNRAIVDESKAKFPSNVRCSTLHGLANRDTPPAYREIKDKMTGKTNALKLADVLKIKPLSIRGLHTLQARSVAVLYTETMKNFMQSGDAEPCMEHLPRSGSLLTLPAESWKHLSEVTVDAVKAIWKRMTDPKDHLPLGHDGYLKMWALGNPTMRTDYVLLDEAQDTNAVVIEMLKRQQCQMVYVGDRYQQIYEWRGAVNAMEKLKTTHTTSLTTSFRFGERIAQAASKILRILGASDRVSGNPRIESRLAPCMPDAILARTNANAITATIEALEARKRPFLAGGTGDMVALLNGVKVLKAQNQSTVPEFFGFESWREVVEFAHSPDGEELLPFVRLVENRGEDKLLWAIQNTEKEEDCDIVISTAHKAKGQEWNNVKLLDDFMKTRPNHDARKYPATKGYDPAELRLFYVALTRAKFCVDVPASLQSEFGL